MLHHCHKALSQRIDKLNRLFLAHEGKQLLFLFIQVLGVPQKQPNQTARRGKRLFKQEIANRWGWGVLFSLVLCSFPGGLWQRRELEEPTADFGSLRRSVSGLLEIFSEP